MKKNSIKNIRNGVIATVIGGIVLFAIPKDIWSKTFQLAIFCLNWLWQKLTTTYALPGWLLIIILILSIVSIVNIILRMKSNLNPENPEYYSYTEDFLFGAKWRWQWVDNCISSLWCYCPDCDGSLVYSYQNFNDFMPGEKKTKFLCENCNKSVVSIIKGGDELYALKRVEREIARRIRREEYKQTQ